MTINGSNTQAVFAIHLTNGTTVLGRILSSNEDGLLVAKPMVLMVQPGPQPGAVSVSMMPYLSLNVFPALDELPIPDNAIMLVRPTPAKIEAAYIELTSGIAIAPAGSKF